MVAMKNATENAEELIEDLTLTYNKVRQANITREMIEIASGAQRALTPTRTQEAPTDHGDRRTAPRPAASSRSPDPSSTSSSRPASCRPSTTPSRSSARARSRSTARSSSTSATTGSARWP